jgi:hypothetical protein
VQRRRSKRWRRNFPRLLAAVNACMLRRDMRSTIVVLDPSSASNYTSIVCARKYIDAPDLHDDRSYAFAEHWFASICCFGSRVTDPAMPDVQGIVYA